ncbi:DUF397 domain-containing protein [Actinomadura rugatobispora]|uniref:DUF397 domain-containing protein n=1 Tax=Actinomadura rugatobispora TaxID=1994 RepID=A0ABW1AGH2_9ACTN|nr:hypothetical protein GCM10010200_025220 [Actinomadura rugatobispora]
MKQHYNGWRKSSHSSAAAECVEVARSPQGAIGVRDTKQGDASPILELTPREWASLLHSVRSGQLG